MSTTTRAHLLLSAAVAALALTGGAVESVERATNLLEGSRLTVHIPNSNRTDPDIEHRIDFCPRGRALIRSTFDSGQTFQRSRGRCAAPGAQRGAGR